MKLSFLGFGEAASSIAFGLSQEGLEGMRAFDILLNVEGKRDRVLAALKGSKTTGVFSPGDAVTDADVVIAIVPPTNSIETAESGIPYLKKGSLYIDASTATPEDKQTIGTMVEQAGAKFIDGAMLGPLLRYKHKVPMLLSGAGSEEVKSLLEPYHMNLTIVEGPAGTATSIKFIRSISAKGIACVLFETMQAANYFHVEDTIVESLCESYGATFESVIDGYISGTCIHARRREHEMENVEDMLAAAGLPHQMVEATRQKLAAIADLDIAAQFPDGVPRNWRDVLKGWKVNGGR